ncbi:MAG: HDIG domain-containing protein [Anaerolineales bacterium]|nr:HDIG domain-containing protein [Anaerolineales bacterium]
MNVSRRSRRTTFLPILVLVLVSILTYLILVQTWSFRQGQEPIRPGGVAREDLQAPVDLQYVSEVRTEEARLAAERAVEPVYAAPDPSVAREQVDQLNAALQYITAIRSDENISLNEKREDLAGIETISLQAPTIDLLLALSPERWSTIQREAQRVLELAMRSRVRGEDVETIRAGLPLLVSIGLTETESGLVVELVSSFIAPNSFYSPELTDAARLAARTAVEPVTQVYVQGQTIVSRGQVFGPVEYEALTEAGLVNPPEDLTRGYIGAALLVIVSAVFISLYFLRRRSPILRELRSLLLLALLFAIFLVGARLTIPNRTVLPYLYPIPAFGLLVSALFGMETGVIFSLLISILAAYGLPETLWLVPYYILTSLCGVLGLGPARRVAHFLFAAGAIAGAGTAVIMAYRFPLTETDWVGIVTLVGAAAFIGVASPSIALPLQYILAQFLGLTTALQLLEISRPDYPLLKYFLQTAPGTYQHSLQVANLAEQAAESIQADGLLTRVGALFHDVGKTTNPAFFIENQPLDQIDSHEDMAPAVVAANIIRHVTDGLDLVRKHRLPRRIHDFVVEHHGTMITRYQYNQALELAGRDESKVDLEDFRYPGPAPRSRETAILMLADGVEAQARAQRPQDDEQVRTIVRSVIERIQGEGLLDHTPLTQKDLRTISESFATTLRVTYHPRLNYPKDRQAEGRAPTIPQAKKEE